MLPNKLQLLADAHDFKFQKEDIWKVKLMDKYQALATFCQAGKECETKAETGVWSPIYDQAFKLELNNGLRFVTNYKYCLKPQVSTDPTKDGAKNFNMLKTGDYDKFDSECDKSMVGFVQTMPKLSNKEYTMKNHHISCFWAQQVTHYDMEKTVAVNKEDSNVKLSVITQKNEIETEGGDAPKDAQLVQIQSEILDQTKSAEKINVFDRSRKATKRFNALVQHKPNKENDKAIAFINSAGLGWRADTCMMTKDHPDRGGHCDATVNLA